jgi:phosphoglycolate phosphatase
MMPKVLFFDLDGTLIDSRDDLADAINLALAELGFPVIPVTSVYDFIGEGVFNLLERSLTASLGSAPDEGLTNRAIEVFKDIYGRNCLNKTVLYREVTATLDRLDRFRKAVITNKPRDFSVRILEALGVAGHFEMISGGDSFPARKPHPQPLEMTAQTLGVALADCVMIGDSRVDIEAGRNAGVRTVGCTFGFRGRNELIAAGADFLIDDFASLLNLSMFR